MNKDIHQWMKPTGYPCINLIDENMNLLTFTGRGLNAALIFYLMQNSFLRFINIFLKNYLIIALSITIYTNNPTKRINKNSYTLFILKAPVFLKWIN